MADPRENIPVIFGVSGTTKQYSGSVGTSPSSVPAIAGDPIKTCIVKNGETIGNRRLLFSIDGTGLVFHSLGPNEWLSYPIRGGITQIQVKANIPTVQYEIIINTEPA